MPWTMAAPSLDSSGVVSIMARRSKFRNPALTQAEVSLLSGPVWSVNPFRNIFSRVLCSKHPTNAFLSCGDASSGLSISISNCWGFPISDRQDSSVLDRSDVRSPVSFIPVGPGIPGPGVISEGAAVGAGISVGIGVLVGAGISVGIGVLVGAGTSVGSGPSTGAVVGAGMDAAVGARAAAVGDGLVSGPEQANMVVRAMKSAQYSSFDMAVTPRIGQPLISCWMSPLLNRLCLYSSSIDDLCLMIALLVGRVWPCFPTRAWSSPSGETSCNIVNAGRRLFQRGLGAGFTWPRLNPRMIRALRSRTRFPWPDGRPCSCAGLPVQSGPGSRRTWRARGGLKGKSATLGGKPDLIARKVASGTIIDVKTGRPGPSHLVQVMLYMYGLPGAMERHRGVAFDGRVAYSDHEVVIPATAVNETFIGNLAGLVRRLSASEAARRVPSPRECGFCDISSADCPERAAEGAVAEGVTEDF